MDAAIPFRTLLSEAFLSSGAVLLKDRKKHKGRASCCAGNWLAFVVFAIASCWRLRSHPRLSGHLRPEVFVSSEAFSISGFVAFKCSHVRGSHKDHIAVCAGQWIFFVPNFVLESVLSSGNLLSSASPSSSEALLW